MKAHFSFQKSLKSVKKDLTVNQTGRRRMRLSEGSHVSVLLALKIQSDRKYVVFAFLLAWGEIKDKVQLSL